MFFSQPWLLFGLGLCAIPILIHLLSRRIHHREPWAAMRFLRAALDRRARQLRLESLLLLVLRTLIVLLLVLALAEPMFLASGSSAAAPRVQRILLVDLSASMGTVAAGEPRIDRLRREVDAILDEAVPGDRFQLARIATLPPRTLIRQPTVLPDEVRSELSRWDVGEERGDVESALQAVIELLRSPGDDLVREVVILSDWQHSNWQPDAGVSRQSIARLLQRIGSTAKLRLIDVSGAPSGNLAVAQLECGRSFVERDQQVELSAVLRNFSPSSTASRVDWVIQGRVEESASVEVAGLSDAPLRFLARVPVDGEFDVELRLTSEDGFAADNRRFLTRPVRTALRVLVVDGRPGVRPRDGAAGFVTLALQPTSAAVREGTGRVPMQVTVIDDAQLLSTDLGPFDCVWMCDVSSLPESDQQRLTAFTEQGGGVIVTVGGQTIPVRWNEWSSTAGSPMLPAVLGRAVDLLSTPRASVGFQLTTPPHPITRAFDGNPRAGLETTRIDRYVATQPDSIDPSNVVLRFSDGSPAVVQHGVENGQVSLVLTSVDDDWGNWPIWPSFLPLVHAVTQGAVMGAESQRQLTVGDAIRRSVPPSARNVEATLVTPAGINLPLKAECTPEACRLRFDQTAAAGVYRLQVGGRSHSVAVNVSEAESAPLTMDESAVTQSLLGTTPFRFEREWRSTRDRSPSPDARGSLAGPLLLTILALLVIEKLLGWNSRLGVGALALFGMSVAVWQAARLNFWLAAALVVLSVAIGLWRQWRRIRSAPSAVHRGPSLPHAR